MTGRRLYEIVTDSMFAERAYAPYGDLDAARDTGVLVGLFDGKTPPAWAYLPKYERDGWNAAAKRIPKGRR